jgi:protein-tyrosine phosphatase
MRMSRTDNRTRILMVCLGNICRSPTAEGVLRAALAKHAPTLQVFVDSAGTAGYHVGDPPDMRSQRAALRRGIDLGPLRARQVSPADFTDFDLILAMDRSNLRDLNALQPADSRATLALFLDYGGDPDVLEVPDPYYGDARDFERVLDLCENASLGVVAALQKGA